MNHEKMSQCGRSRQNGSMGWRPNSLNFLKSPLQALSIASRTSFCVFTGDAFPSPSFSLPTLHLGQQFCLLHATKHCSGWSATYANRIRNTQQIFWSGQTIWTPFFPASTSGLRRDLIQLCHSWEASCCLCFSEKHSSFDTGM